MPKQTSAPTNPNTAEDGCGNGFSLARALSTTSYTSQTAQTTQGRSSMDRTELLSIIQDALSILEDDFDDDEPDRDIPTLISQ